MKTMKKALSGLLLSAVSSTAFAEDLLDIYQQAVQFDPIYRAGIAQHDADREIYDQALAVLSPTIDFSYSYTNVKEEIKSNVSEYSN